MSVDDLVPIFGLCCCLSSCYCPENNYQMCGCMTQGVLCCMEQESYCCKVAEKDEDICLCTKATCTCIKPTTCVKGANQCFCCDSRCAFPCDDDVPCLFNLLGASCCYNFNCSMGCYKKIIDLKSHE